MKKWNTFNIAMTLVISLSFLLGANLTNYSLNNSTEIIKPNTHLSPDFLSGSGSEPQKISSKEIERTLKYRSIR